MSGRSATRSSDQNESASASAGRVALGDGLLVAELTPGLAGLVVEPDVLHAPPIVLAVDHDGQPFDLRLHAGGGTSVVDNRTRAVLLQLLVDVSDQTPTLFAVGDLGLATNCSSSWALQ